MRILLICVDALRFDHYLEHMDGIEQWGIDSHVKVMMSHVSNAPYTGVALAQILNGSYLLDEEDNLLVDLGKMGYDTTLIYSSPKLREVVPLFTSAIDVFKESSNEVLGWLNKKFPKHPLIRGMRKLKGLGYRRAETMLGYAETHLRDAPEDSFTWVHLMDPHIPWQPPNWTDYCNRLELEKMQNTLRESNWKDPPLTDREKELIKELYVEEVRYLDNELSLFLPKVQGELDIIIITADHGDLLGDYGHYSHPGFWVPELIHVPFVIYNANSRERGVDHVYTISTHAQIRGSILSEIKDG